MNWSDILWLYTMLLLAMSGILYVVGRSREKSTSWELSRPKLVRCLKCNRVFLARRHAQVTRCPRCKGVSTTYIR